MKKLVTSAMALMAGLALATGVNSANTVGFISHEMNESGVDNIGVSLQPVGGGAYTVAGVAFDALAFAENDAVYIFNGEEWDFDIYTYLGTGNGWLHLIADGSSENVASFSINKGDNVYYAGASEDIVVAGEVAASGTQTVTFDPQDNWIFFFVNPFPIATTFANLESFAKENDGFYVFNADEWDFDIYTYLGTGQGFLHSCADGTSENIAAGSTDTFLAVGQGASYVPADTEHVTTWTVTLNY